MRANILDEEGPGFLLSGDDMSLLNRFRYGRERFLKIYLFRPNNTFSNTNILLIINIGFW